VLGSEGGLQNRGGEDRWLRRLLLAVFLNSLDPGISPSSPLPPELPPAVVGRIRALPHGATTVVAAVEAPCRRARRWRVASGQPSPRGFHPHRDQWLQYNLITLLHQVLAWNPIRSLMSGSIELELHPHPHLLM